MKKKLFKTTTLLIFLLTLGGFSLTANAQNNLSQLKSELHDAIIRTDVARAFNIYPQIPLSEKTPLLQELSNQNIVLAQWFLSDSLIAQGRKREGLNWLYTASLGTRMDMAICKSKDAKFLEGNFLNYFSNAVNQVRYDEVNRRDALNFALLFHSSKKSNSYIPEWACYLTTPTPKAGRRVLYSQNQTTWFNIREKVYLEYQRNAGFDTSKPLELFKIVSSNN